MNFKSRKATMYIVMALIVLLMPIIPVFVEAGTTGNAGAKSAKEDTTERTASYQDNTMDVLSANEKENVEFDLFDGKAIAIVSPSIEVLQTADEESETVGLLYESNIADVVEQFGEWTKIKSGELVGYVKSETLCFDEEAKAVAMLETEITATVTAESTKQYSDKILSSEIIGVLNQGDEVIPVSTIGIFVKIQLEDTVAYVAKEDIEINYGFENGLTNEQIAEAEAARKAAEEAEKARIAAEEAERARQEAIRQQMIQNTKDGTDVTYNPTMTISDDDLWILACIIDWESGWEPYEGKLAVANVVLNRLRSGRYGNTVADVVYAKGQFSGANSAQFAARIANGPRTTDCMKAAMEALSGVNNVGVYSSFISVSIANVSAYEDYMIIGNHCFH